MCVNVAAKGLIVPDKYRGLCQDGHPTCGIHTGSVEPRVNKGAGEIGQGALKKKRRKTLS